MIARSRSRDGTSRFSGWLASGIQPTV